MKILALSLVLALSCTEPPGEGGAPSDSASGPPPDAPATPAPAPDTDRATIPGVPQARPTMLDRYDFERRARRFELPGRLDEISGLAFSPDGRLFGHDDERARLHQIDPLTGEVGKRFDLGETVVRGDFEGLAIVGERFFLVTSVGILYEFREGSDEEEMTYRVTDARLDPPCEVEGLDFDPVVDALLLACKTVPSDPRSIVVHLLPLDPRADRPGPLRIPKSTLTAHGLEPDFDPSAVAVDPQGTILLLAGRQSTLIEIDRTGAVLSGIALSSNRHPQAEGLAIGPDGTLYIADERDGRAARLTAYGLADRGGAP